MSRCSFNLEEMRLISRGVLNTSLRHLDVHQEYAESKEEHEILQESINGSLHSNSLKHLRDFRQNLNAALLKRLERWNFVFADDYFYTIGETYAKVTSCEPSRALFRRYQTKVYCSWSDGQFSFEIDPKAQDGGKSIESVKERLLVLKREASTINTITKALRHDFLALRRALVNDIAGIKSQVEKKESTQAELGEMPDSDKILSAPKCE